MEFPPIKLPKPHISAPKGKQCGACRGDFATYYAGQQRPIYLKRSSRCVLYNVGPAQHITCLIRSTSSRNNYNHGEATSSEVVEPICHSYYSMPSAICSQRPNQGQVRGAASIFQFPTFQEHRVATMSYQRHHHKGARPHP